MLTVIGIYGTKEGLVFCFDRSSKPAFSILKFVGSVLVLTSGKTLLLILRASELLLYAGFPCYFGSLYSVSRQILAMQRCVEK